MDTSILEELGMTKSEASIYLAILRLGETKVGSAIEKTNLASSAVHNSINSLIEKGFLSFIKKGKIKYYKAINPKQLLSFLEEKKKKLNSILPELESFQASSKEQQEAEVFEGTKGIIALLNQIIEDAKKRDEYLFFSINVKEENKEIQDFFSLYDIKRKDKELLVKGLAPKELKLFFAKRKTLKMRYTNFPIPANISICNNQTAIFSWGEKPVGYLIKSEQISQILKDYFNKIWFISS